MYYMCQLLCNVKIQKFCTYIIHRLPKIRVKSVDLLNCQRRIGFVIN